MLSFLSGIQEDNFFQIAVAVWYFSAGADRALIIPTVNAYLTEYLGAPQERYLDFLRGTLDQVYMGIVISIFAIGSLMRLNLKQKTFFISKSSDKSALLSDRSACFSSKMPLQMINFLVWGTLFWVTVMLVANYVSFEKNRFKAGVGSRVEISANNRIPPIARSAQFVRFC
jgi:hypothetical protein